MKIGDYLVPPPTGLTQAEYVALALACLDQANVTPDSLAEAWNPATKRAAQTGENPFAATLEALEMEVPTRDLRTHVAMAGVMDKSAPRTKITIGYWRETKDGRASVLTYARMPWTGGRPQMRAPDPATLLPWPGDSVDPSWDPAEREAVLRYLEKKSHERRAWRGISRCRLCGRENGCCDVNDGVYVWPSGLIHYVADHQVRLPKAFVAHVREKMSGHARRRVVMLTRGEAFVYSSSTR